MNFVIFFSLDYDESYTCSFAIKSDAKLLKRVTVES